MGRNCLSRHGGGLVRTASMTGIGTRDEEIYPNTQLRYSQKNCDFQYVQQVLDLDVSGAIRWETSKATLRLS